MFQSLKSWSIVVAGVVAAAGLTLVAQGPAPAPAQGGGRGQAPGGAAGAGAGAAGAAADPAAAGRQGAGGRAQATPEPLRKDPVLPLTPAEEAKHFILQPGYKMEPVLTDPDIQEPAQIAFDGNGRMFVLEIRGYMQDADATGELLPVAQISVHEDKNNDGIFETHHVFVDHLIFPRFVMPLGANAILTKESNADEVWKFTDTNGDGVADKKELFTNGFGRLANVEHQESGLMWAMDNWMYSTINQVRLRITPSGDVIRENIGSNGGQWGVTQDNYGKVWFQAGASGMPGYFQFPIEYGGFDDNNARFEPNLNYTWGAPVLIADMQGGMGAVRWPDGSLNRSTAGAGNDIFRGDHLPKDLIGDYFYGETVARIVRRFHPVVEEGFTQLRNVYPMSEFLKSTDPLFRPVDMTTAPDGTLYITDIYRGIVQESQWSGPGTYLRGRIEQFGLDKVVRHGRIWRLSYEGMGRNTTQPHMLNETAAQLVPHLNDPNGWWRDTAQQLLVLKQDKSVVPALKTMAQSSPNQLARIHALWTLEGLNAADPTLLRAAMKDSDPKIRQAAIRVSESNYKAGDRSFGNDYKALAKDPDIDTQIQAVLTLNTLKVAGSDEIIKGIAATNKAKGMKVVTDAILNPNAGAGRGGGVFGSAPAPFTTAEAAVMDKGKQTFTELCFSCHGTDGRGEPIDVGGSATKAPPLAGSPRVVGQRDYVIKVLLNGLTGPVDSEKYTEVMIPMGQQTDEWIANVASYVRNSFGNRSQFVTPADVARVRAATASRKTSWTVEEINASLPKQLVVQPTWKLTASQNTSTAMNALSITPWHTAEPMSAGMWLQMEFPQPVSLTEIQFESAVVAPENMVAVPGAPTRTAGGAPRGGAPAGPPPEPGFPRGYQVQVSMDGTTWGQPIAQGASTGIETVISFAPVQAKFVRITQTSSAPNLPAWSVQKLRFYEPGK